MNNEGRRELVPIDSDQLDDAVEDLKVLKDEMRGADLLVILSLGDAQPGHTDWDREGYPLDTGAIDTVETPAGRAIVCVPIDPSNPDETPWSRWWDAVGDAGGAINTNEEDGRRLIIAEVARLYGWDTQRSLIRIENAVRGTLKVLRAAKRRADGAKVGTSGATEFKAERQRIEAELQARHEAEEAERRVEQERIAAEHAAERERLAAERRAIREERARVEAEQQATKTAATVADPQRADWWARAKVVDLLDRRDKVPWREMPAAVERAGFEPAPDSTLRGQLKRYRRETGDRKNVPARKRGRRKKQPPRAE